MKNLLSLFTPLLVVLSIFLGFVELASAQDEEIVISKEAFAREMLAEIGSRYADGTYVYNAEHDEIRPDADTKNNDVAFEYVYLGNIYNAVKYMAETDRIAFVDEFLEASVNAIDEQEPIDKQKLRLRLRTPTEISNRNIYLQNLSDDQKIPKIINQEFGPFLIEVVVDGVNHLRPLPEDDLEGLGLTATSAHKIALENTAKYVQKWVKLESSLWVTDVEDDYDCVRLAVLGDVPSKTKLEDLIVFMPSHSVCLVTTSEKAAKIQSMIDTGYSLTEDHRSLSNRLYKFSNDAWVEWLPPKSHPAFSTADMQALQGELSDHQEQNDALQRYFQDIKREVIVPKFSAIQTKTGDLKSYAVFTPDLEIWLPKVDMVLVSLEEGNGKDSTSYSIDWADFERVLAAQNIKPAENIIPIRYVLTKAESAALFKAIASSDIPKEPI